VTRRLPHTLRSDARDNRELILDAARAVFAADGLNVPMREIARRAGVGPATLYRHFLTKEMLVTEALAIRHSRLPRRLGRCRRRRSSYPCFSYR
jgi:AcrR family transcriptional regulator